ncbi:MAG: dUTP diphosphatase [Deltaproteobacteria bacterium]|nr:dUTP diphosphatase [Deltaproteobacteria bacterium]
METIQFKRVRENTDLPLPSYETELASGMDLRADIENTLLIKPGERVLVPTGLSAAFAPHLEAQIRPRSGLAFKKGISMVNTPGTIDADYRGEIKIILINLGGEDVSIERGERIAQMVLVPVVRAQIQEVQELSDTDRGVGGFGSTGVN